MTPHAWRRRGAALVLALALCLAPAAPAAALPFVSFDALSGPAQLWARAWRLVQHAWTKEGGSIDPNGALTEEGGSIDPDGAPTEEGGSIDPNGQTKEGGSIDPDG